MHFAHGQWRERQQAVLAVAAASCDDRVLRLKSSNLQGVIQLLCAPFRRDIPVIDHRKVEDLELPREAHLYDLDSIACVFDP